MKSSYYNNSRKEQVEKLSLWDAFVTHLESTYFPGASEVLETKLIAFEYELFKECYSA